MLSYSCSPLEAARAFVDSLRARGVDVTDLRAVARHRGCELVPVDEEPGQMAGSRRGRRWNASIFPLGSTSVLLHRRCLASRELALAVFHELAHPALEAYRAHMGEVIVAGGDEDWCDAMAVAIADELEVYAKAG